MKQPRHVIRAMLASILMLVSLGCEEAPNEQQNYDERNTPSERTTIDLPCTSAYELDRSRDTRYVIRPGSAEHRFTLICGTEENEVQATDIVVTPGSNLRLVNELEDPIRVRIGVPEGRTLFGFRQAWFHVAAGSDLDLRVQAGAEPNEAEPYGITVEASVPLDGGDRTWESREYGDPDPKLKVKPYP